MDRALPRFASDPLPEVIYHYTDTTGLLSIPASDRLWATDYRFLDDRPELSCTYRLVEHVIGEEFSGSYTGRPRPPSARRRGEDRRPSATGQGGVTCHRGMVIRSSRDLPCAPRSCSTTTW